MTDISFNIEIDGSTMDPDILQKISRITVEDNGIMADIFKLFIPISRDESGDWNVVTDEHFSPMCELHIKVKVDTEDVSLIKGYVTDKKIHFDSSPGISYLEIIGMDATCLMNLEQKIRDWPGMSDSDICSSIFSEYDFTPEVESTQPVHDETKVKIIQRGTDIQFIRRLARRNGFECYVESDASSGIITGYFRKPVLEGTPQKELAVSFGSETNVTSLDISYECLKPVTSSIMQLDIDTKSTKSVTTDATTLEPLGSRGTLDEISQATSVIMKTSGVSMDQELSALCEATVDSSAWAITAIGEVDTNRYQAVIRSKRTILLKGTGSIYSGIYYVSRVVHSLSREGYSQRFELRRNAIGLTGSEEFGNNSFSEWV